jgi:hypothetical protein
MKLARDIAAMFAFLMLAFAGWKACVLLDTAREAEADERYLQ